MNEDNKKETESRLVEDIALSPITGSSKDVKRALYWKINHDSYATGDDVERASYILENFSQNGVPSGDVDFAMEQVKQWMIAELSKSDI